MVLLVLTFCALIKATGICKFARMFPNHGKKEQNIQLPRLTTDSFKNSSLALTPGSTFVFTSMVPWSTSEDATTVETKPIVSRILPSTDADCPEWTKKSGSLYCFISRSKSWEEAVQICQRYSSRTHLVFIESADENAFLTDFFNQKRQGSLNDAWIGLNDREKEGDWKWGEEKGMLYSNWSDDYNEPNGDEKRDQDCAFISMFFGGEWVDELCVTTQAYLICEHEIM